MAQNDTLINVEDGENNLNCLLNDYNDDNDGENPIENANIDSKYYEIEDIKLLTKNQYKYYTMHFNILRTQTNNKSP